jgi:hypothetical protein
MISPLARIHTYYVIKQAGTPSSTIELEYAASCQKYTPEPPAWLIRHCEVGDAIASLPRDESAAVGKRWAATINCEECDRAIRIAGHYAILGRRIGQDASEWVHVGRDAEREAEACRGILRTVDRSKVYRDGMGRLFEWLSVGEEVVVAIE